MEINLSHISSVFNNEPDAVYLVKEPISMGAPMLDTLELLIKDGRPTLLWAASWRGGYGHADGAGAYVPLPDSVLAKLSAKTVIGWIQELTFLNDVDLKHLETDRDLIAWCERNRRAPRK